MNYEHLLKYVLITPMGTVVPFEGVIKAVADSKGITYEEELKNYESFKDSVKNIRDVEYNFHTDQYEEVK